MSVRDAVRESNATKRLETSFGLVRGLVGTGTLSIGDCRPFFLFCHLSGLMLTAKELILIYRRVERDMFAIEKISHVQRWPGR